MTNRRYIAGPVAAILWLLLATLWLAYRITAKAARRALPPILRWLIPRPSYRPIRYRRVLGWFPQRQQRPRLAGVPAGTRVRMSSSDRAAVVRLLRLRDGDDCRLCGHPIDFRCDQSSPWAEEVDHVIPVALGGPCDVTNFQLLHAVCNKRKGARVVRTDVRRRVA